MLTLPKPCHLFLIIEKHIFIHLEVMIIKNSHDIFMYCNVLYDIGIQHGKQTQRTMTSLIQLTAKETF